MPTVARPHKLRNTACKVQIVLLYGTSRYFGYDRQTGDMAIHSIRGFARSLGMTSARMNRAIEWLETMGYITHMAYAPNKRSIRLRLRGPVNG